MSNEVRHLVVPATNFKMDAETGTFTCYGNVKHVIDHAADRALDGVYQKSIDEHRANGTMPKMFWMHNPYELPVGPWLEMSEDHIGLRLKGKLSKTTMGADIEILAKDGALDCFSIGYIVIKERWNAEHGCNDLIEIKIVEVSWVNFACNEESRLTGIKSTMQQGGLPTKRELQKFLKAQGLSTRQSKKITDCYAPLHKERGIFELMAELPEKEIA